MFQFENLLKVNQSIKNDLNLVKLFFILSVCYFIISLALAALSSIGSILFAASLG